jgi:D-3-phosphoglycerate dehydrogenase
MKIVIIGYFTEYSKMIILNEFPVDWEIDIVSQKEPDLSLKNTDLVTFEHIKVDLDFFSKEKKLKFVQTGARFNNVDIISHILRKKILFQMLQV